MQCFKLLHQKDSELGVLFDALHYERFLCFLVFNYTSLGYLIVGEGLLELILSCTRREALGFEDLHSRHLQLRKLREVELTVAFVRCKLQAKVVVHNLLVR